MLDPGSEENISISTHSLSTIQLSFWANTLGIHQHIDSPISWEYMLVRSAAHNLFPPLQFSTSPATVHGDLTLTMGLVASRKAGVDPWRGTCHPTVSSSGIPILPWHWWFYRLCCHKLVQMATNDGVFIPSQLAGSLSKISKYHVNIIFLKDYSF